MDWDELSVEGQPKGDLLRIEVKTDHLIKELRQVKVLVIDLQRELIKSGAIVLNPETETLL